MFKNFIKTTHFSNQNSIKIIINYFYVKLLIKWHRDVGDIQSVTRYFHKITEEGYTPSYSEFNFLFSAFGARGEVDLLYKYTKVMEGMGVKGKILININ